MGWTKNRWVRLFFALWVLWAALDTTVLLLLWLFPPHFTPRGYHESGVATFFSHYTTYLYHQRHPNWNRLTAVLRLGPAIVASFYVAWRLASAFRTKPISH